MEALAEGRGVDLNGPDPAPAGGLPQQGGPRKDRLKYSIEGSGRREGGWRP